MRDSGSCTVGLSTDLKTEVARCSRRLGLTGRAEAPHPGELMQPRPGVRIGPHDVPAPTMTAHRQADARGPRRQRRWPDWREFG